LEHKETIEFLTQKFCCSKTLVTPVVYQTFLNDISWTDFQTFKDKNMSMYPDFSFLNFVRPRGTYSSDLKNIDPSNLCGKYGLFRCKNSRKKIIFAIVFPAEKMSINTGFTGKNTVIQIDRLFFSSRDFWQVFDPSVKSRYRRATENFCWPLVTNHVTLFLRLQFIKTCFLGGTKLSLIFMLFFYIFEISR